MSRLVSPEAASPATRCSDGVSSWVRLAHTRERASSPRVLSVHSGVCIPSNAASASVNVVVAASFRRCRRWSWTRRAADSVRALEGHGQGLMGGHRLLRHARRRRHKPGAANIMLRQRAPTASSQARPPRRKTRWPTDADPRPAAVGSIRHTRRTGRGADRARIPGSAPRTDTGAPSTGSPLNGGRSRDRPDLGQAAGSRVTR